MANTWGLPDNEIKQLKKEIGVTGVSPTSMKSIATPTATKKKISTAPDIGSSLSPLINNVRNSADYTARALAMPINAKKDILAAGINTVANLGNKAIGKLTGYEVPYESNLDTSSTTNNLKKMKSIGGDILSSIGMQPVPAVTAAPSVMSTGQTPQQFVKEKGGVQSALDAVAGRTPQSSVATTSVGTPQPVASPTPAATPAAASPVGTDTGSGFAMVDGKKINYPDIGSTGDPLRKTFTGSGVVPGQGENSGDIISRMIQSPDNQARIFNAREAAGVGNGGYDDEVKHARDIQDQLNLSGIGVMKPKAAVRSILARQKQQEIDQEGQKLDIGSMAMENELAYKNRRLAIDAPLIEAQAKNNLAEAEARKAEAEAKKFAISPEGVKREAAKGDAKEHKELINKYYDSFKSRQLPPGFEGKHMDLAKKFADAENPESNYGIHYNLATPQRMGVGIHDNKSFLEILQHYRKGGYPDKDAYPRAIDHYARLGGGYEPIPAMGLLFDRPTKDDAALGA